VCLPDLHSPIEASSVAGKLLACLEEPFDLAEMAVSLSASIGVAFSGEHGHEPEVAGPLEAVQDPGELARCPGIRDPAGDPGPDAPQDRRPDVEPQAGVERAEPPQASGVGALPHDRRQQVGPQACRDADYSAPEGRVSSRRCWAR